METRPTPGDRAPTWTMLGILVMTLITHLLGAGPLRDSFWGVHLYAFLPSFWLGLGCLVLLVCSLLLCPRITERLSALPHLPDPAAWPFSRRWLAVIGLAGGGGCLLWLARARQVILGDGSILIANLPQGESYHPREPLTAWLQQAMYRLAGNLFRPEHDAVEPLVAQSSVALGSVLAGVVFLPVAWVLARQLVELRQPGSHERATDWTGTATFLTFLVLSGQGYMQLFCGYVENYTFYALGSTVYLWTALLYLRWRVPFLVPTLVLLLAGCLHLAALTYLPCHAVLLIRGIRHGPQRNRVLRDLILGCGLAVGAVWALQRLAPADERGFGGLFDVVRTLVLRKGPEADGYLLSAEHLRDFVNEQWLIGPLGLWLFVPTLFLGWHQRLYHQPVVRFLALAGIAYLAASWLFQPLNLGYPRDWDLLAVGSLVFTTAGLGFIFLAGTGRRQLVPILLCGLLVSWFHTVPWVAVNSSFDRSFARLKTFPSQNGLTETNVGRWYLLQGDRQQAEIWLDKALAVNPANNNANFLRGQMRFEQGDYLEAANAFGQAVSSRPDKPEYRVSLIQALIAGERWLTAARECEELLTMSPMPPAAWGLYGMTLLSLGHDAEAEHAFSLLLTSNHPEDEILNTVGRFFLQRGNHFFPQQDWLAAQESYRQALRFAPGIEEAALNLGFVLVQTDQPELAIQIYEQALTRHPESVMMLLNLGAILHSLGRDSEARPHLERALQLEPDGARAPQLRALLQQLAG
ncbi:MAG: tetratricopeptide repeat protein [bacterium]